MTQLPETVKELVRLIGESEAIVLMEAYPKMEIDIPRRSNNNNRLHRILTAQSVKAICDYFKGERLYIPDASFILREYRNQNIIDAYGEKSASQLAREHNLSVRWIRKILAETRAKHNEGQMGLF